MSGWGTGRKAKHEIGRRAAALKLKLAQWAVENSPRSPARIALLFIIQEVERDSDHGPPYALFILLLSDKMNCKVGFVNCLLKVSLYGVPVLLSRK